MTPVNTSVPISPWLLENLISSRASFDFGHGFDLHGMLYGRAWVWGTWRFPGFFWGKMGYLEWMGFSGEMRQTRCVVSDVLKWYGTRRSFFLIDNDLNLMGRKCKHSYWSWNSRIKPVWYVCYQYNVQLLYRAVFVKINWAVKKENQLLSSKGRRFYTLNSSKKNTMVGSDVPSPIFSPQRHAFRCDMFDSCF